MEKPHRLRIKHDLLGIDAELRSSRPLSERDVFDVLKKQDPELPNRLLKKYRIQREKKFPDQELLKRYETAGIKAMENGFFETDGSFTEGLEEGAKMIGRGARSIPISMNLSANLRAISENDLGGDPEKYAGEEYAEGVEKAAQQLYGLVQTDKALEMGLPDVPLGPLGFIVDYGSLGDLFRPAVLASSDFNKNMDKALAFGGMPNDPSAKRIVMNRVLELDERKSEATRGQGAMEAWGGLALLGEAGKKLIKKNPLGVIGMGMQLKSELSGEDPKDFDRRAELDYLANQEHIVRNMEEGAEMATFIGSHLSSQIDKMAGEEEDPSFIRTKAKGLVEAPFGGAETLTDLRTGAVQPDRDQAAAMSLVMSPDVPLTLGASGALSVVRNATARGAILSLSRKAVLENSAKTALEQFKAIPKPNAVQKQLIARAEKVLKENAGAQQKLNLVVNKNQAIGQRIGLQQGVTKSGNYNLLGQRVQEALARTSGPEASITRRVTGQALQKAGFGTEQLGKALELMHRVPDEVLARALINSGFQPENVPSVLKTLRIAGAGAIGFSAELDPNAAEALGLILLTPGGYKLLTRAGSDMAILGRQLQYAKASSPLFQRLAQMDPANPSLSEVTIDRTAALTVPEAVSDVTSQVLSPGRNFGISPMLKGPSTFLTKTGLGNTLESAASTAKTATYASAFPLAFGYAVGGEEGAGMGLGASLFPLTVGMGVGHFAKVNSKFDLAQKLAADEVIFKDSLDATQRPIYESMPRQVRQAIATGQMQNPDVMIDFREGRGNSEYQVVDGESQIKIYAKSAPAEVMQAVLGHEIAHHIDKFGYSTLIQEQLLGSVEKDKPGIFTEFDKDGKPIVITEPDGRKVYKTNKEFAKHRQVYLDKLEASGYGPGTSEYSRYKNNNSEIAREIFASHGAAEFFGGKFVKDNYEGAGSKLVRSLARPLFNSSGMRNFFHRIGLASNERGLVADPTKLMPGLKEIPELTQMIKNYNSEMRGLDTEGRRAWARRSGNLVDNEFADEFASANLTAKDLENPAVVERLKAGGHVAIKDDGSIQTDASGKPVFLPTREVNKRNKNLSNDILDILRKKQGQFKEGHVELETTATGAERASGGFLGADIIAALKRQNRYNPHQLDALGAISRSIEAGGGDAWDLFYYSALKFNKAGRKVYGQIKGGDRLSIPFGMEITKDGNILINTISVDQFRNNLKYFATSPKFKQKMAQAFNASNETEATQAALRALPRYLENQRNNIPNDGTNGVTVAQRDFINAALGAVNNEQVVRNPILEAMGKNKRNRSVAIRSRRLDRIGNAVQSQSRFGQYDPSKVSQNLMPQMELDFSPPKAAQSLEAKPNFWKIYRIDPKGPRVYDEVADVLIQVGSPWMDGSIIESQAPLLGLEKGKLRQAMNRAHRRADRGGGKQFMPASEAGASKGKLAEAAKLWQEKGTDSPYFKKWFGKSKVVDENGEPLVVYHGGAKGITIFDTMRKLPSITRNVTSVFGSYFSPNKAVSERYIRDFNKSEGETYSVYLSLENPYEMTWREWQDFADKVWKKEATQKEAEAQAKEFRGKLEQEGYDGIIVRMGRRPKDKSFSDLDEIVAFSPEQIKSTGNRGTFDAGEGNILFMPAGGDKLTATHNLSAEALAKADELGGLPVPSVGITKGRALEGFGEVTLLGTRPLVDPELGVPAFGSDVYSKRFPREKYKPVKIKKADEFFAKYKSFAEQTDGSHELSLVFEALVNSPDLGDAKWRFISSDFAKMAFLKDKGKGLRIPKKKESTDPIIDRQLVDEVSKLAKYYENIRVNEPEWVQYSKSLKKAFVRSEMAKKDKVVKDLMLDALFDENNLARAGVGDRILREIRKYGNTVIDKIKLRDRIENKFTRKLKAEYERWATQEVASLFDEPYIIVDRKKVPLTLETATDAMVGRIRAIEKNMTFGPGEARSMGSPKMSSIQEMRNRSDAITSKKQFDQYTETVQDPIHEAFKESAMNAYKYSDTWTSLDLSYRALGTYLQSTKGTKSQRMRSALRKFDFEPNDELVNKAIKAAEVLRDAPTEYFEAKPQRAVMLKEFVGAVIPKNAGPKVKQLADKYGWEVKTYDSNKPETRQTAVKQLANRLQKQGKEVLFMPSDPKAPKRQPVNRVQQQARSMPANRFMAPASMAKGELSERFR